MSLALSRQQQKKRLCCSNEAVKERRARHEEHKNAERCGEAEHMKLTDQTQDSRRLVGYTQARLRLARTRSDAFRWQTFHFHCVMSLWLESTTSKHNNMAPSKPLTKTNRITKKGIAATKAAAKEQQEQRSKQSESSPAPPARRNVNAIGPALDVNGKQYDVIWKESKKAMGKPSAFMLEKGRGGVAALGV